MKIAFLLLPSFSNMTLTNAVEPLFLANWLAGRRVYAWETLSLDGRPVAASNGTTVPVDGGVDVRGRPDAAFVVASFDAQRHARDERAHAWLRRLDRFGVVLGGIETGSEVLAAAGLLDGHDAAVHWDNLDGFRELYPEVNAAPQLYTIGETRLTCAGATAALDMMLHWVRGHVDVTVAEEIAEHLVHGHIRDPGEAQRKVEWATPTPASPPVIRAVELMQATIEEPRPCAEIARSVGLSLRQLERHFELHLGTTPARHYLYLRLARAHKLLQQTSLPVTEVAAGTGFASAEHFSRVYRRTFGVPPSRDRRQSPCAPVLRQHPARWRRAYTKER